MATEGADSSPRPSSSDTHNAHASAFGPVRGRSKMMSNALHRQILDRQSPYTYALSKRLVADDEPLRAHRAGSRYYRPGWK